MEEREKKKREHFIKLTLRNKNHKHVTSLQAQ